MDPMWRILLRLRVVKDPKKLTSIGFAVFSLQIDKKPLVLLCFRSKLLRNQWFYYVFAQKCWKSIGFIVFSLTNVEKPLVLLCFR